MSPRIEIDRQRIAAFCRQHGIERLSLFGSVLTDRFGPQSDIDVLVEFAPDARVSLLGVAGMELELEGILGREVDLRTPLDLSRYFRDDVVRGAELLYAAEDRIRLRHMLDAAEEAMAFCAGMTEEQFAADSRTLGAVLNCLQVIGEAANHIPEDVQAELPGVPWRQIIRMRHRLVHVYFDVNAYLLWRVVQDDLPVLATSLRHYLSL